MPGHLCRMDLREYLLGQRIELVSSRPRAEVVKLINAATPSSFVRSQEPRVRGKCALSRLRLFWDTPNFSNGFRPVFSGAVRDARDGTMIHGRWGATRFTQFWFLMWYGICFAALLVIAAGLVGYAPWERGEAVMLVVVPILASVPAVAASMSIRQADEQLRSILEFLHREVQAQPNGL